MKPFYQSALIEVPQIEDVIEGINERGAEIICISPVVESQQLLVVTREPYSFETDLSRNQKVFEKKWAGMSLEEREAYREWFQQEQAYRKQRQAEREKTRG